MGRHKKRKVNARQQRAAKVVENGYTATYGVGVDPLLWNPALTRRERLERNLRAESGKE